MADSTPTRPLINEILEGVKKQKKKEAWDLVYQVGSLRFDLDERVYQLVAQALKVKSEYETFLPVLVDDVVGHHQNVEAAFKAVKKAYEKVTGEKYTGDYSKDVLSGPGDIPPADGSE